MERWAKPGKAQRPPAPGDAGPAGMPVDVPSIDVPTIDISAIEASPIEASDSNILPFPAPSGARPAPVPSLRSAGSA